MLDQSICVRPPSMFLLEEVHIQPRHWSLMPLGVWKFIDDFLAGERLTIEKGQRFISQDKEKRSLHALESESLFNTVSENAKKIGMSVNNKKLRYYALILPSTRL